VNANRRGYVLTPAGLAAIDAGRPAAGSEARYVLSAEADDLIARSDAMAWVFSRTPTVAEVSVLGAAA
jgi:hypothetical protein